VKVLLNAGAEQNEAGRQAAPQMGACDALYRNPPSLINCAARSTPTAALRAECQLVVHRFRE